MSIIPAMAERIELWPVDRLRPYERNARTHSPEQVQQIAASMVEFGLTNPILVDSGDGIIAGHGRLMAAQLIGLTEVPVIVLDHLSDAQRRAYILADNAIAEKAGWDEELLAGELADLAADGFDLALTGFSDEELADLLDVPEAEGDPQGDADAVGAPPAQPVSVLGDVWLLGRHRLMCGDSTSIDAVDRLMAGSLADMVFTDPPYGYKYESNHQDKHTMLLNDDVLLDFMPAAYAAMAENSAIFVCGSHQTIHQWRPLVDQHFTYKNLIVWKKNNWSMGDLEGAFAGQHELIIFAHKGRAKLRGERSRDVWEFSREAPDHHPTQKPVDLVEFAISKVSDRGAIVLDLFGGSGSTLMACEKTARSARLMELDPKYIDVIVKRWEQFTGKQATLEETGQTFADVADGRGIDIDEPAEA